MPAKHWKKIEEIFQAALERPSEERDAYLNEVGKNDARLKKEVQSLLAAHMHAGNFLESASLPLISQENKDDTIGKQIGHYRIERQIGQGGMGNVYLAVRDDKEFKKRVALKIVKRGMDTDDILRRFRHERQTLAALDHPNIARLLDGGTTEDGLPYFVMEYIEGMSVDIYCDTHRLNTLERLKLFRAFCSAVHFAHQNLVIHRDIKPGNILVTEKGQPKLLDFGIAKLMNPELTAQSIRLTRDRMQLMTPEFASPEQIRGDPITTASDVYSLGVLLYKLLTGHPPYCFKNRVPLEIERVISKEEPEKPSTVITRVKEITEDGATTTLTPETVSKTREGQPNKLRRRLLGDLDNIIMMAMRKEPQRRYASVEQFSQDIRRHLEGLPVIARPSTWRYQSIKFIKRHKRGVFAATLIFLILLAGISSTVWQAQVADKQRQKAEQRFNDVRKLANALIFEIHDAITDLPGSTSARELLVSRALEYLDILAKESEDDPSLQLELTWAYKKIGDVQGNPNNANLGDISGALESYHKGIALAKELIAVHPDIVEALRAQAVIYEKLSDVQSWSGELPEAIESNQKSLEIFHELTAVAPENHKAKQSLAISHIKLGDISGNPNFPNVGKNEEALYQYQQALSILNVLYISDSSNVTTRRYLGLIHERTGTIFEVESLREQALESYHKSMFIRRGLAKEWPTHYDIRRDLAIGYEKIANMDKAAGNTFAALGNYHNSLAVFEELYRVDPKNTNAQRSLSFSYEHVGDVLKTQGKITETLNFYQKSLVLREKLSTSDMKNRKDTSDLGTILYQLADLSVELGNKGLAKNYTRRLLELQNKQADSPDANAYDLNNYAWSLLTCEPESLRDYTAALRYAQKAVEMSKSKNSNILDTLALAYFLTGDRKLAVETEEKALSLLPADSPMRRELEANLAKFITATNN